MVLVFCRLHTNTMREYSKRTFFENNLFVFILLDILTLYSNRVYESMSLITAAVITKKKYFLPKQVFIK